MSTTFEGSEIILPLTATAKFEICLTATSSVNQCSAATCKSWSVTQIQASIWPNPVLDILNFSSDQKLKRVYVFDRFKRLVMQQEVNEAFEGQIDVQSLPEGMYFLQMETISGIKTIRKFYKK